ncbi:MAG: DUF4314 domain-containing protein [Anaerolineaceae bacterium]|nr:DUF4314 domain-containing protein [Anaerolineaceae bacterium]
MSDFGNNSVAYLRTIFKPGIRVIVKEMDDPYPIEAGIQGSVEYVDDAGVIHCRFDNGRYLGLLPGVDSFDIVS